MSNEPKIAIALGGGAARGLAHIVILEALDELGVKPSFISGCSIGALLGAAYASGLSAAAIREHALSVLGTPGSAAKQLFWPKNGNRNSKAINLSLFRPISLNGIGLVQLVSPPGMAARIEDTEIPFCVVSTDFYSGAEVTIDQGDLETAVAASIAIPGVISAPKLNGRVMIDGAYTNPVPVAQARRSGCDILVGIDVTGRPRLPEDKGGADPGPVELMLGATQIMQKRIIHMQNTLARPDVFISPNIHSFSAHEFLKIEEILAAAEPEREALKRRLEPLLAAAG